MSERLAPPGWQGNFWGPEATKARHEGKMPPIVATAHMARWDRWGKQVLRDGDIVFRLGDARVGRGYFPMSRFLACASNSKFSHTGIVAIEVEGPVVYDTTRMRRVPATILRMGAGQHRLDRGQAIASRIQRQRSPKSWRICHKVFEEQVPFDYQLSEDDSALYCIEMTEKAYRSAGIELSKPIRLGDMERAPEFPLQMFGLRFASKYALERPLTFDQLVYFPGNENHGIWSARQLMTVVPATYAPGHPGLWRLRFQRTGIARYRQAIGEKISSPGPAHRRGGGQEPAVGDLMNIALATAADPIGPGAMAGSGNLRG